MTGRVLSRELESAFRHTACFVLCYPVLWETALERVRCGIPCCRALDIVKSERVHSLCCWLWASFVVVRSVALCALWYDDRGFIVLSFCGGVVRQVLIKT